MPDHRFFTVAGPYRLGEIAEQVGGTVGRAEDGDRLLRDVAPLDQAGPDQLSFLDNKKYVEAFRSSSAGACIVHGDLASLAPPGMALLLSAMPYRTYALAARLFYPLMSPTGDVAATACVDPTARLGTDARVEAGAVIGAEAEIGPRCVIGPNAVIGRGVGIGEDSVIGANASLSHCLIGARVVIYPGVRIGQRGFGFAMEATGPVKVPQLGRVIVEDDVEVGANTTIDRGSGPDTVIGAGTMIDNLVQIAHNVQIGRGCIVIAQAGIAGSTRIGDHVVVAAQAGVAGHLEIGDGAQIGAQSGVMRDVAGGARVVGAPAVASRQFFRQIAALERLTKRGGS